MNGDLGGCSFAVREEMDDVALLSPPGALMLGPLRGGLGDSLSYSCL